eukprot:scaffold2094_cov260-Alexandrium_tamarense.AAC.1
MFAADDRNAAITTPERRNNSGILPSDAGCPAGWGWGSAIWSLVANNTTTPTTAAAITTNAATATTTRQDDSFNHKNNTETANSRFFDK